MAKKAKISRGSWCLTFGMERPLSLEQVVKLLSAFNYDGIEIAGFLGHATLDLYSTKQSRKGLVDLCSSHNLEMVGYAPGPYGDFGKWPWATGSDEVVKEFSKFFDDSLQFCVDTQINTMRVDPGNFGPLARDADYNAVWDRVVLTFQRQAEQAANVGVKLLWEPETGQIFVKPSEIVKLMDDVNHPNLEIMYDMGHFQAIVALGHNQVQPVETLAGGQVEMIKKLAGKIGHMHVCDSDNNTFANAFGTHLGIGKGKLNVEEILGAVIETGYEGWWSVDAIPMGPETIEDTYTDIFTLRDMLGRLIK